MRKKADLTPEELKQIKSDIITYYSRKYISSDEVDLNFDFLFDDSNFKSTVVANSVRAQKEAQSLYERGYITTREYCRVLLDACNYGDLVSVLRDYICNPCKENAKAVRSAYKHKEDFYVMG